MTIETGITGTTENSFSIGDGTINVDDGYKYLYAKIRTSYCPGFRWNEIDIQWEYSNDGYIWQAIGSGGLPSSTFANSILQGDGIGSWSEEANLTLSNSDNRSISISQSTTGVVGRNLQISAGASLDGNLDGGNLYLISGATNGSGTTGGIEIYSEEANTISSTSGDIILHSGDGTNTLNGSGNVLMYSGEATGANSGSVGIYSGDSSNNTGALVLFTGSTDGGNSGSISVYTGTPVGSGVSGSISFVTGSGGNAKPGTIYMETGSTVDTNSSNITIKGGDSTNADAGSVEIDGGDTTAGTAGNVYLGYNYGTVSFGLVGNDYQHIFANSDTDSNRAGLRYNNLTDKWQLHYDNDGTNWYDFGYPSGWGDGYQLSYNGDDGEVIWAKGYYNALVVGKPGTLLPNYDGYLLPNLTSIDDESFPAFVIPTQSYFTKLRVQLGTAPGAGESVTVTVRTDNEDTLLTLTLSDSDTIIWNNDITVWKSDGIITVRVQTSSGSVAEDISVTLLMYEAHLGL